MALAVLLNFILLLFPSCLPLMAVLKTEQSDISHQTILSLSADSFLNTRSTGSKQPEKKVRQEDTEEGGRERETVKG